MGKGVTLPGRLDAHARTLEHRQLLGPEGRIRVQDDGLVLVLPVMNDGHQLGARWQDRIAFTLALLQAFFGIRVTVHLTKEKVYHALSVLSFPANNRRVACKRNA